MYRLKVTWPGMTLAPLMCFRSTPAGAEQLRGTLLRLGVRVLMDFVPWLSAEPDELLQELGDLLWRIEARPGAGPSLCLPRLYHLEMSCG